MSSIIIEKLKEIENANVSRHRTCSTSIDVSTSEVTTESSCPAASTAQTVSILTNKDSDFYQEYHTVKIWAAKLRSLKRDQRLYAEKAIYDVLFEAQLGNLKKSSVKINEKIVCTKQSNSMFNVNSSNSLSQRSYVTSDQSCAETSQNHEHEYRSSEVIIAESFPTELAVISSECQVKLDDISILKPCTDKKRRKKPPGAVLSDLSAYSKSRSRQSAESESEENINKYNSLAGNAAINVPDYILSHFSRYIHSLYNYFRNSV